MMIFFIIGKASAKKLTKKVSKTFLSFFKRTCIFSVTQPNRLLFQNWLYLFSFVSLKEVDAALLCVAKAKPGPTFFRELGDKGNKHFWYWKIHLAFYLIMWYELNVFLKKVSRIWLHPHLASSSLLGKSLSYARENKEAGLGVESLLRCRRRCERNQKAYLEKRKGPKGWLQHKMDF